MKRPPNQKREAAGNESNPKRGAAGTRKQSKTTEPAVPAEAESVDSLGDVSIADLEAVLERRLTRLSGEKTRLEAELASLDAEIAAELAKEAAEDATAEVVQSAAAPVAPSPRAESIEPAPRKRGPGRPSNKAREAALGSPPAVEPAPIASKHEVLSATETKPVPVASSNAIPESSSPPAKSPQDPAIRKPTLGSRLLAVLTREHPNAMNAAQLVEKLRAPDQSAPAQIAVLQSLRALRVNGMLWSGDGESFGLTPAGLKRARAG